MNDLERLVADICARLQRVTDECAVSDDDGNFDVDFYQRYLCFFIQGCVLVPRRLPIITSRWSESELPCSTF